jgi:hypothetical protein
MNNTVLTRDEVSLLIHSIQRTIISLEKYDDGASELVRKHRVLLKTLLDIEQDINKNKKEPITIYK